jgi:hypothetical protein
MLLLDHLARELGIHVRTLRAADRDDSSVG